MTEPGLKLTIVGSSPAYPNPDGACSGYLVESRDARLLVDCGHGVTGILQTIVGLERLSGIIISHMHPDHFFDLVPLKYGFRFQSIPSVPLLLPPGGRDLLHRLQAAIDEQEDFFAESFQLSEYDPEKDIHVGDLRIQFAHTQHFIPAYAMRFSRRSNTARSLFYSSDTAWSDEVVELARGATLALVEATRVEKGKVGPYGHLTGLEAGELARAAGIERLILTHYPLRQAEAIQRDAAHSLGASVELATPRATYNV